MDIDYQLMYSIMLGACTLFLFLSLTTKNCCRAHDFDDTMIRNQLSEIKIVLNAIKSMNDKNINDQCMANQGMNVYNQYGQLNSMP